MIHVQIPNDNTSLNPSPKGDPRRHQFIIADGLRALALERSAKAGRERTRALDGPPERRELTLEYAWALQQQANGLWDAAHFAHDLDLPEPQVSEQGASK